MMKKISVLCIVVFLTCIYNCERDDICADTTQTTASLVIETFDVSNRTQIRNVANLRIEGIGNVGPLLVDGMEITNRTSNIVLPLRTDVDSTQFILSIDTTLDENGVVNGGNADTITVRYSREDRFVSRACGFSTIFSDVTITLGDEPRDDQWIRSILAENDNQIIEDEDQRHFSIFH
jgi:hypothetical protein